MGECTASLRDHTNTVLVPRGCIASLPEMADEGRIGQRVNTVLFLAEMMFLFQHSNICTLISGHSMPPQETLHWPT